MIFVQRIFPKPTPKSITAPFVPCPPVCALHGGRFRKTANTEPWCCGPIAGDAATQRCARYFHAVLPGLQVDRGELARVGRDVHAAVADRRRELDEAARVVRPELAERRRHRERDRARARRGQAEHRPRHAERQPLHRRRLRRDELHRGGAADVAVLVHAVDHVRGAQAGGENDQHGQDDQQAAPHRARVAAPRVSGGGRRSAAWVARPGRRTASSSRGRAAACRCRRRGRTGRA